MTTTEHTIEELKTILGEIASAASVEAPAPNARSPHLADPDPSPEAPTVNTTTRPELPAYFIASIAIICIAVLTGMNKSVPDVLNLVTIGALGIGGAITTPNKQQG
jgi:hypothetical protein